MQKKELFNIGIIALLLVASFLVLNGSNGSAVPVKASPTCCKKSVAPCSEQARPDAPAETGLEHISHQFISLPVFFH